MRKAFHNIVFAFYFASDDRTPVLFQFLFLNIGGIPNCLIMFYSLVSGQQWLDFSTLLRLILYDFDQDKFVLFVSKRYFY